MYYIGNLEIFDPHRYGQDETNSPGIEYHWMVVWCSAIDDVSNTHSDSFVQHIVSVSRSIASFHRSSLFNSGFTEIMSDTGRSNYLPHIANGDVVCRHYSYLAPQIVEIEILPGGECIGIPRGTFWLKIFQRKWRNILKKREHKIRYFRCIKNFMNRELGVSARISVV